MNPMDRIKGLYNDVSCHQMEKTQYILLFYYF
jgi:hypothetical protein